MRSFSFSRPPSLPDTDAVPTHGKGKRQGSRAMKWNAQSDDYSVTPTTFSGHDAPSETSYKSNIVSSFSSHGWYHKEHYPSLRAL
ncbi:hypothetical protein C0995_009442 [Termitomyces sp. Mi166|nr:hypothetical protein C0995_009442 [Termitomyces sp. Mi166\